MDIDQNIKPQEEIIDNLSIKKDELVEVSKSKSTPAHLKKILLISATIIVGLGGILFFIISRNNNFKNITYKNEQVSAKKEDPKDMISDQSSEQIPIVNPNESLAPANYSSLSDKIIYIDNAYSEKTMILVSDRGGDNPFKLIDSQHRIALSFISQDKSKIFYVELVDDTATIYQKNLKNDLVTKILSFNSPGKNSEFFSENISISSDEKFIVYGHNNGDVSLYDIEAKTTKNLLHKKECLSLRTIKSFIINTAQAGGQNCYGYYKPQWSPDGKKVVILKIFYEGGTQIVIDPFETNVVETNLMTGGSPAIWFKNSSSLIISGEGYSSGGLYIINLINSPTKRNILEDNIEFSKDVTYSVAMSADESLLAFSYYDSESGIGLYDLNGHTIKKLIDNNNDLYKVLYFISNDKIILQNTKNMHFTLLNINTLKLEEMPITGDRIIKIL